MAQKRMFSLKIIDTDLFLDMPMTTRLLYYDLSMRADDDGFVASPKKIQRMIGCSDDDFKLLIAKQFIIPFESGVCVIKHWRIHNYIQKDRYNETLYQSEKNKLEEINGTYEISHSEAMDTKCIQNVSNSLTQVRLDKVRLDKVSKEEETPLPKSTKEVKHKYGEYNHVMLTDIQYSSLITDFNETLIKNYIKKVDEYIEQCGKKYRNFNLTIRNWISRDKDKTGNGYVKPVKKTSFADYEGQREYDFDELERKLLDH